jgi:excisionase family DNA binding protein
MYVSGTELDQSQTLVRRVIIGMGPGGGPAAYLEYQPRPFSSLNLNDLINTADLCQLLGCSARTVYRWVAENNLAPVRKVHRDYLFTKAEILRWYANDAPHMGRPRLHGRGS